MRRDERVLAGGGVFYLTKEPPQVLRSLECGHPSCKLSSLACMARVRFLGPEPELPHLAGFATDDEGDWALEELVWQAFQN